MTSVLIAPQQPVTLQPQSQTPPSVPPAPGLPTWAKALIITGAVAIPIIILFIVLERSRRATKAKTAAQFARLKASMASSAAQSAGGRRRRELIMSPLLLYGLLAYIIGTVAYKLWESYNRVQDLQ